MRCCSGGPSAPELAVPAEKKMSVADSFAGFADSMASIASLPAEAQKDMIEYVRDLRELLAGGMLTGAGRLDSSLYCAPRGLLSSCSAPLPHRPSCGVLLLCLVSTVSECWLCRCRGRVHDVGVAKDGWL